MVDLMEAGGGGGETGLNIKKSDMETYLGVIIFSLNKCDNSYVIWTKE